MKGKANSKELRDAFLLLMKYFQGNHKNLAANVACKYALL
jgi:hypothetical protein